MMGLVWKTWMKKTRSIIMKPKERIWNFFSFWRRSIVEAKEEWYFEL
jgi:hypothetical protein